MAKEEFPDCKILHTNKYIRKTRFLSNIFKKDIHLTSLNEFSVMEDTPSPTVVESPVRLEGGVKMVLNLGTLHCKMWHRPYLPTESLKPYLNISKGISEFGKIPVI